MFPIGSSRRRLRSGGGGIYRFNHPDLLIARATSSQSAALAAISACFPLAAYLAAGLCEDDRRRGLLGDRTHDLDDAGGLGRVTAG